MYIRSMINLSLILVLIFSKIGVIARISDVITIKNTVSYTVEYIYGESTEVLKESIYARNHPNSAEDFIRENKVSNGWELIGETTE